MRKNRCLEGRHARAQIQVQPGIRFEPFGMLVNFLESLLTIPWSRGTMPALSVFLWDSDHMHRAPDMAIVSKCHKMFLFFTPRKCLIVSNRAPRKMLQKSFYKYTKKFLKTFLAISSPTVKACLKVEVFCHASKTGRKIDKISVWVRAVFISYLTARKKCLKIISLPLPWVITS